MKNRAFLLGVLFTAGWGQPNVLTEAEKAAGWELMFNGKSLAGWHSFRSDSIKDYGWTIKDSSIYLRAQGAGALLAPEQFTYKNFEISLDWKLPDSGNSGVFLRYLETQEKENIRTGPETQICGRLHPDYRGGIERTSPGACYAMFEPSHPWIRSAQEFNTLDVIMYEDKVAHFGNGTKLLEYVIGDPVWKARFDTSKYNPFPLYGDIHAGKLFLQDHASRVWYRNIKIRPLAEDPWASGTFQWPDQRVAIRASRNGFPIGLRLLPSRDGRIRLGLDRHAAWDLDIHDIFGRNVETLRGDGTEIAGSARPAPGIYRLQGSIDGRPVSRTLAFPRR
ncbi:MAG: hypothetical protein JWP91_3708 [Fibrobacteres bacterium]|nr:hypothetical protein [Fibrobacterota bacterium]